jgi:hypothetical protein
VEENWTKDRRKQKSRTSVPKYDGWFIVIADQIVEHLTIGMEKE